MLQKPKKTQTFNDGICDISIVVGDGEEPESLYKNLRFGNKIFGYKRFFTAAANDVRISKVIRIPYVPGIDTDCTISIGDDDYEIKMMQTIDDVAPTCFELTLQKVR